MPKLIVLIVALAVSVAACGGSGKHSSARTTTTRRSTTTVAKTTTTSGGSTATSSTTVPNATTPTTASCGVPNNGSVAKQTSPLPSDVMLLTGVSVRTRDCKDTVMLTFRSSAPQKPGYTVSYQPGPFTQDASGKAVTIAGSAFLVVRLEPATGFDFTTNKPTYTGPDRIKPAGGAFARDLVRTGDFESVTTWVIGVRSLVPFSVQATGAPNHSVTITIG